MTEVVDDYIPVFVDSWLPLWNLSLRHPWLLILVKVWAKRNEGYPNLKLSKSF